MKCERLSKDIDTELELKNGGETIFFGHRKLMRKLTFNDYLISELSQTCFSM